MLGNRATPLSARAGPPFAHDLPGGPSALSTCAASRYRAEWTWSKGERGRCFVDPARAERRAGLSECLNSVHTVSPRKLRTFGAGEFETRLPPKPNPGQYQRPPSPFPPPGPPILFPLISPHERVPENLLVYQRVDRIRLGFRIAVSRAGIQSRTSTSLKSIASVQPPKVHMATHYSVIAWTREEKAPQENGGRLPALAGMFPLPQAFVPGPRPKNFRKNPL